MMKFRNVLTIGLAGAKKPPIALPEKEARFSLPLICFMMKSFPKAQINKLLLL